MILCVRFTCFVHPFTQGSATDATLDTGGWLTLSRRGLAPRKMHQASLGALTPSLSSAATVGRITEAFPKKPQFSRRLLKAFVG